MTGIREPLRACAQVERTRASRRVVSGTLWAGAQRETRPIQRCSAAPFHGSTPRHGERTTPILRPDRVAGWLTPPQAESMIAAVRMPTGRNLFMSQRVRRATVAQPMANQRDDHIPTGM
jgi:hypothetical protein